MQDTVNSTDPIPGILNQGCSAPLVRLTNDSAAVKKQIMSMSASGETYIAPGLLWGWRSLSPNAPFADGAVYSPATRKVIVLMTDGANTHSPNYPDHEGTNTDAANKLTAELCSSIKKTGIDIYTIAFDVSDVTIKSILQSCATSPSFYYDATTVSSMQEAFGQIATALAGVRLVQ
jgi:Mg-chelatase subunit ChlD